MLLTIRNLIKRYEGTIFHPKPFVAVDNISFCMKEGEILGLMGHSGCGKTTTAKMVASLIKPTAGEIIFRGNDIVKSSRSETIKQRKALQIIFQNPHLSLNPHYNVRRQLAEPIKLFALAKTKSEINRLIALSMEQVHLSPELLERHPNEISGGQAQRVAIARALCLSPRLLIADEAISMLDLTVQAQIIELLREIHANNGISILMISHDKEVVGHFCDRVLFMDKGKLIEAS